MFPNDNIGLSSTLIGLLSPYVDTFLQTTHNISSSFLKQLRTFASGLNLQPAELCPICPSCLFLISKEVGLFVFSFQSTFAIFSTLRVVESINEKPVGSWLLLQPLL